MNYDFDMKIFQNDVIIHILVNVFSIFNNEI